MGDLVDVIKKLAARSKAGGAKLDAIVTLVDAKHVSQHLDEEKPEGVENEAVEQVAFAGRLILNKCDLVPEEADLAAVEQKLRDINKFAKIIRSTQSIVDVADVLHINAFDLDKTLEMDPEFLNTEGEHEHDTSVSSIGVDIPGEVDIGMLQDWLGTLLKDKGTDLYRMKGVLAIQGESQKYQYHAVHMLFNGTFADEWGDEERSCKLTFIGKNLNHDELRNNFYGCMATEDNLQKRLAALRFDLGTEVECRTGADEWSRGKIVDRLWKSPSGQVAPYQIELADGKLIFAPADDNQLIRLPKA